MIKKLFDAIREKAAAAGLELKGRLLLALARTRAERDKARRVFEAVLRLKPSAFGSHLRLGVIALLERRRTDAVRSFCVCMRLDKERLERIDLPRRIQEEVFWRDAVTRELDWAWREPGAVAPAEPPPFGPVRRVDDAGRREIERRETECAPRPSGRTATPVAGLPTDASSPEEALRFRMMGPIGKEEIEAVDIDDLIDDLLGD